MIFTPLRSVLYRGGQSTWGTWFTQQWIAGVEAAEVIAQASRQMYYLSSPANVTSHVGLKRRPLPGAVDKV